jgi:hypothetical protein
MFLLVEIGMRRNYRRLRSLVNPDVGPVYDYFAEAEALAKMAGFMATRQQFLNSASSFERSDSC